MKRIKQVDPEPVDCRIKQENATVGIDQNQLIAEWEEEIEKKTEFSGGHL